MKLLEVQKLKTNGCVDLENLCVINIKGEADKVIQFLQGQITSDINKLTLNSCALSSVCNQKGQIVSDFIISSQEDGLKILVSKESAKLFANDLEPYAKFFGVLFEPSKSKAVGFINMRSKKSMSFVSNDDYVLSIGIDESIDKNTISLEDWEAANIMMGNLMLEKHELGIYRPSDINYDHLRTSFEKGCFRGQEIVARMKYLGKEKSVFKIFVSKEKIDKLHNTKKVKVLREIHSKDEFIYMCIINKDMLETLEKENSIYFIK